MRWWVTKGGQPEGPFEQAQVADLLRGGKLPPTTQVAPETGGGWTPISQVPEFAPALSAAQAGTASTMAVDAGQLWGNPGSAPGAGPGSAPGVPGSGPGSAPGHSPLAAAQGVPKGNPMVAGTMAMDSESLMKAMSASQAGLGVAPGYTGAATPPPTSSPGFGGGPSPGGFAMGPGPSGPAAPAEQKRNPLLYVLGGCGCLALLSFACVIGSFVLRRFL